jgi:hypothetical protein
MTCNPLIEKDKVVGFICTATISKTVAKREYCPTCKKSRKFLCEFEEWYGWTITCLTCGDQWMDGQRGDRPFERGWRKKAVEYAKKRLSAAAQL